MLAFGVFIQRNNEVNELCLNLGNFPLGGREWLDVPLVTLGDSGFIVGIHSALRLRLRSRDAQLVLSFLHCLTFD